MKWRVFSVGSTVPGMFSAPHPTIRTFRWEWVAAMYCEFFNLLPNRNYRYSKDTP